MGGSVDVLNVSKDFESLEKRMGEVAPNNLKDF